MPRTLVPLLLLALAAPLTAQTTGRAPPPGEAPIQVTDLDLPIQAPQLGPQMIDVPGLKRTPVGIAPGTLPRPSNPDPTPGMTPPRDDPRDVPSPTFYGEEIPAETATIFYVIDSSGSMDNDSQSFVGLNGTTQPGSRMERAKTELVRSIMGLAANFSFNIISYDCGTVVWSAALRKADAATKQEAIAWVLELEPRSGTGTGPATALALNAKEVKTVVLLTDGRPNCGADGHEGHRRLIASHNTQGAKIHVFGIAASGDYRAFCQSVAADSGGSYYDVP